MTARRRRVTAVPEGVADVLGPGNVCPIAIHEWDDGTCVTLYRRGEGHPVCYEDQCDLWMDHAAGDTEDRLRTVRLVLETMREHGHSTPWEVHPDDDRLRRSYAEDHVAAYPDDPLPKGWP